MLNFEFSKMGENIRDGPFGIIPKNNQKLIDGSNRKIKQTIYKKLNRGILKRIPLNP